MSQLEQLLAQCPLVKVGTAIGLLGKKPLRMVVPLPAPEPPVGTKKINKGDKKTVERKQRDQIAELLNNLGARADEAIQRFKELYALCWLDPRAALYISVEVHDFHTRYCN